ncbi:hypothetical protein OG535_39920 [Kitasatospora sp. NBC_00085]|uniref:hypothetical protein n=1 Tax=unclassified Kitasatospora TaxID=2633591 RepID=UPI00324534C5
MDGQLIIGIAAAAISVVAAAFAGRQARAAKQQVELMRDARGPEFELSGSIERTAGRGLQAVLVLRQKSGPALKAVTATADGSMLADTPDAVQIGGQRADPAPGRGPGGPGNRLHRAAPRLPGPGHGRPLAAIADLRLRPTPLQHLVRPMDTLAVPSQAGPPAVDRRAPGTTGPPKPGSCASLRWASLLVQEAADQSLGLLIENSDKGLAEKVNHRVAHLNRLPMKRRVILRLCDAGEGQDCTREGDNG